MAFYIYLQYFSRNMYEQEHFYYYRYKAASSVLGFGGMEHVGQAFNSTVIPCKTIVMKYIYDLIQVILNLAQAFIIDYFSSLQRSGQLKLTLRNNAWYKLKSTQLFLLVFEIKLKGNCLGLNLSSTLYKILYLSLCMGIITVHTL